MSKSNNKGYGLHKERVIFGGSEIVRTIKYPLSPTTHDASFKNLQNLEKAIIDSDLKIRGPVNLNDYVDFLNEGKSPYTLIDFWVDSLRAGVVWQPSIAKLINLFRPNFYEEVMKSADPRIHKYFEITKFIENVVLQSNMRSTASKNSKIKLLNSCLKSEFVNNQDAHDLVLEIIDNFFDETGVLRKDINQAQIWQDKYGIKKPKLRETQNSNNSADVGDITFTIVPELIDFNEDNIEVMVTRRQEWLVKNNKNNKGSLESVLGISENANALSNYLNKVYRLLINSNLSEIINQLIGLGLADVNKKDQIEEALVYLVGKARTLGLPVLSELVGVETGNWADYRQNISGKLNSWLSNYLRRKDEIGSELKGLKYALVSLPDELKQNYEGGLFAMEEEQSDLYNSIIDLSRDILRLLDEEGNIAEEKAFGVRAESPPLFDNILSELKRKLNIYYQKYLKPKHEEETCDKRFPHIFAKIKAPMSFYGQVRYKANEKLVKDTIKGLEEGVEVVKDLAYKLRQSFNIHLPNNNISEDALRCLDFVWRKYATNSVNSERLIGFFVNFLTKNTAEEFHFLFKNSTGNKYNKYRYFISPYEKGALSVIKTKYNTPEELIENFITETLDILLSSDKNEILKDKGFLIDWVELSKTTISRLISYNKGRFNIKDYELATYGNIPDYCKVFMVENVDVDRFKYIVNSFLFSSLKGYANVYSKDRYIAKYTMQIIRSDEKFPIYMVKKDLSVLNENWSENPVDLLVNHRYFVGLTRPTKKKVKEHTKNALQVNKNNLQLTSIEHDELGAYAVINTSYYQTQFLDRLIYKPKEWANINIKINEPSFVLEKEYIITWDLDTKRPKFTSIENSKHNKLYLALPFTISAINIKDKAPIHYVKENPLDYPILGVDVGEYGLAYALCKFSPQTANIIDCGFIYSSEIANIQDKFSLIQQRSRTGLFNQKLSIVERVRTNAIGSLRNKLHVYVVDNLSTPIYEFSIKNFETGSGKITKIYNSVKRADTEFESEADKSIHNHVWGKGTKYIGRALSSYGSSYTCVNCCKSVYEIEENNVPMRGVIVLESDKNPIFKVQYGSLVFNVYSKSGINETNVGVLDDKKIGTLLKKAKDYARPPVESAVLAYVIPNYYDIKHKLQGFRDKRGNSAIFVCPFCNYLSDADIQAAFVMAVRGYINLSNVGKKESAKAINYFKDTLGYLEGINNRYEIASRLKLNF